MSEESGGRRRVGGHGDKVTIGEQDVDILSSDDSRFERPTTIDSLALKRATLPLQLLPIDLEKDSSELATVCGAVTVVAATAEQRRSRSRIRDGRSATAKRVERAILDRVTGRKSDGESWQNSMERRRKGRADRRERYDDVGPPPSGGPAEEEDEDYDDVGPPSLLLVDYDENDEGGIYDDVGDPVSGRDDRSATTDNDYSSIEDDETYDDVGRPETSDERVNSIYAGSEFDSDLSGLGSPRLGMNDRVLPAISASLARWTNDVDSSESRNGRRLAGRAGRTERRRSRVFRKNRPSGTLPRGADTDTASDDSNYETLFSSFPSDEFSSGTEEAEEEEEEASSVVKEGMVSLATLQDPADSPSRLIPPPPRESSLTETFGRRIKMLRRTWSITKGSLGRMRRRTLTSNLEEANRGDASSPERPNDARKYFSFKKRFGKRGLTGLSTFYLETETAAGARSLSSPSEQDAYRIDSGIDCYANTEYGWRIDRRHDGWYGGAGTPSLEEQEPLYQFYAAAAARISFESDSEGYEEVRDPTTSSSEPELAQPAGRNKSLWCQTSRVKSSRLLQGLTLDEKKCQEAKFEILTSETSYLNSLRVLVDEFLNNHHLVHEILTPRERERLFGGVPGVLRASERLLGELEAVWREDPMLPGLPRLLSNYASTSSSAYIAYCSNQVSIDATLKELRNRRGSKFVEAIARIESRPACQSLSLHSFLMLPMQRVTRLPLLADAVLSKLSSDNREERKNWEGALSELSRVVIECNEGARAAGRLAETEALERKLEYSPKVRPIELKDRYLIRRGPVVRLLAKSDADYRLTFGKKYHKTRLCLFLLTDHLLIAKLKPSANEETYTVMDSCKRNLLELESVDEDSPFAGRNAMLLTLLENHAGRHVEYILACESPTERERWLDAVSPAKPSLVGESLYETWDCPQAMLLYPYAATQPDELSVQPGEVINVLRKMSDGWHLGEKLLGGEQGWFPGNYAKEVASEHVRAKNLRLRHRLLALSTSVLQQRAKPALR